MIGIDNGLGGGIVVLNERGQVEACYRMPTVEGPPYHKNAVDAAGVYDILMRHQEHEVVIETFPGARDSRALRSMADSFARIHGAIRILGMPCEIVIPTKWQKTYWKVASRGKSDTKAIAEVVAAGFWPEVTFVPEGCRTPHSGLLDAALIARWGMSQKGLI